MIARDLIIEHEGETWKLLSRGISRNGKVYCHLASTTRFTEQRNGRLPMQIGDWIDAEVIARAQEQRFPSGHFPAR